MESLLRLSLTGGASGGFTPAPLGVPGGCSTLAAEIAAMTPIVPPGGGASKSGAASPPGAEEESSAASIERSTAANAVDCWNLCHARGVSTVGGITATAACDPPPPLARPVSIGVGRTGASPSRRRFHGARVRPAASGWTASAGRLSNTAGGRASGRPRQGEDDPEGAAPAAERTAADSPSPLARPETSSPASSSILPRSGHAA